jgi:hypothetical protein
METSAHVSLSSPAVQPGDAELAAAAPFGVCDWCGRPKVEVEAIFAGRDEMTVQNVCLFCRNQGRREHGWG